MAKNNNSDFIDIKSLLHQYKSHWYLFAASVVLCLLAAVIYISRTDNEYSVRANVLISQQKDALSAMGSLGDLFGSDGYVDDEIFIISSHTVYRDVVKTLRLNVNHKVRKGLLLYKFAYPDYPVDVIPAAGIVDTLRNAIGFKIKVGSDMKADIAVTVKGDKIMKIKDATLPKTLHTPYGDFTVTTTPTYPAGESVTSLVTVKSYDSAAETLDENVVNEIASKRSNVINMSIKTTIPEYGKNVLNTIIAMYNRYGVTQKNAQGELTATFLDSRLEMLAADLSRAEEEIERYKEQHGIVDVSAEAVFQTEKRARLEQSLLDATTQSAMLTLGSEFIADPANRYSTVPQTVDNEGLADAITNYNALLVRRQELLLTATPQNEELRRIERRIEMQREVLAESFRQTKETAEVAVAEVRAEMATMQNSLDSYPQQEREFLEMQRQLTVKNQLYYILLTHAEENAMLLANATPKGEVIDEAYTLSEPLGLSKKAILALALILGLFIPPFILWVRRLMYNRFESRAEVERMTDVPILGEMCIDKTGRHMVVTTDDTSSSAELFRLMRSNLLFVLTDPRDKVVLMTSTSSGEGKSFISINLAASLALLGKKVMLMGMDIRNPQLANYLDLHPRFGLTQYLSSADIELNDIITPLDDPRGLDVICAGPVPPNPAEMLLSTKVDRLFEKLRERYDYIIVDTAPIGLVSDTFTLDRIADASIYVCRANYTSLTDLELINDIHEQHRLKKVSLVINGTAAKKSYGYKAKNK